MPGDHVTLGNNSLVQHPFQLIIHPPSCHSRHCIILRTANAIQYAENGHAVLQSACFTSVLTTIAAGFHTLNVCTRLSSYDRHVNASQEKRFSFKFVSCLTTTVISSSICFYKGRSRIIHKNTRCSSLLFLEKHRYIGHLYLQLLAVSNKMLYA